MGEPHPLSIRVMGDVLDERVRATLAGEETPATAEEDLERLRMIEDATSAAWGATHAIERDVAAQRAALIRLAAACLAWCEAIDREAP